MENTFRKDFYSFIPLWIRNKLDMKLLLYRREEWFETAWDEYRKMCFQSKVEDVEDPDYFFVKKEKELTGKVIDIV